MSDHVIRITLEKKYQNTEKNQTTNKAKRNGSGELGFLEKWVFLDLEHTKNVV